MMKYDNNIDYLRFVSINNRTVILRKMLPKTETNKIEQSKFFDNQAYRFLYQLNLQVCLHDTILHI